jgi:glycosyltransferase involved in cell wall biosynthesis
VLALRGGAVEEIVYDGISGWICCDIAEMAERIESPGIAPELCREFVERRFSIAAMADRYLDVYEHALVAAAAELEA